MPGMRQQQHNSTHIRHHYIASGISMCHLSVPLIMVSLSHTLYRRPFQFAILPNARKCQKWRDMLPCIEQSSALTLLLQVLAQHLLDGLEQRDNLFL